MQHKQQACLISSKFFIKQDMRAWGAVGDNKTQPEHAGHSGPQWIIVHRFAFSDCSLRASPALQARARSCRLKSGALWQKLPTTAALWPEKDECTVNYFVLIKMWPCEIPISSAGRLNCCFWKIGEIITCRSGEGQINQSRGDPYSADPQGSVAANKPRSRFLCPPVFR